MINTIFLLGLFAAFGEASLYEHFHTRSSMYGSVQCPKDKNDIELLQIIRIPLKESLIKPVYDESYAEVNDQGRVISIQIFDEPQISLMLFCLSNLQFLDIRRSQFDGSTGVFPHAILRLSHCLQSLRIESMPIHSFPKRFGRLKITDLSIINISLPSIPESFSEFTSLKRFTMEDTNVVVLPDWFNNFRVETLELRSNPGLSSIDALNGNPWVKTLKVNDCSIQRISLVLPNLYYLDTSNNFIRDIENIEKLGDKTTDEKHFIFTGNFIKRIPDEIYKILNLTTIIFDRNPLRSLPMSLLKIKKPLTLGMSNTCLHSTKITTLENLIAQSNLSIKITYSRRYSC